MNRLQITKAALIACAVSLIACGVWLVRPQSPESALAEFYAATGVGEVGLMDALILAGDGVVPLVIRDVGDPDMPRRRYAIGFLGNGGYEEALPVLRAILEDESEVEYFRGDALRAIYQIDRALGLGLAEAYREDGTYLGDMAGQVRDETEYVRWRRSYTDAILSVKD